VNAGALSSRDSRSRQSSPRRFIVINVCPECDVRGRRFHERTGEEYIVPRVRPVLPNPKDLDEDPRFR
jgi:hypothetical protein